MCLLALCSSCLIDHLCLCIALHCTATEHSCTCVKALASNSADKMKLGIRAVVTCLDVTWQGLHLMYWLPGHEPLVSAKGLADNDCLLSYSWSSTWPNAYCCNARHAQDIKADADELAVQLPRAQKLLELLEASNNYLVSLTNLFKAPGLANLHPQHAKSLTTLQRRNWHCIRDARAQPQLLSLEASPGGV